MKKTEKLRKEAELTLAKIRSITRHIRNVEDNCLMLGEKLILQGNIDLGKRLIAHGFIHDASKFTGIEFEYLSLQNPTEENNKLKLKMAIHHHNTTNLHHPEAWTHGIKGMPPVYLAEFVCDTKARSEEFGTDLRAWITDCATKKFGFTEEDEVYKDIMIFVNLLCDKPFEQIK